MTRTGKCVHAEEAIAAIQPTDTVIMGHLEPKVLVEELCRQADRLEGLKLIVWPYSSTTFYLQPEVASKFRIFSLSGSLLKKNGNVEYLPVHVSHLVHRWPGTPLSPTVALLHVSRVNEDQTYSMGIMADYTRAFVSPRTRLVIAEANICMPRTWGPNAVERWQMDYIVETEEPIEWSVPVTHRYGDRELQIARHVSEIVPDGATIQVGANSITGAILRSLGDKKELGFHSGVLTAEVIELIQAGTITNSSKPRNTGKSVTATYIGDDKFFGFLESTPEIEIWPNSYTHDLRVIADIPRFVALNVCLQVDVLGQVYSEAVGGRLLGTVGGQGDFMRGAAYSEEGLSIVALSSTTRDGNISKITAAPFPEDFVTVPQTDVDFIVTEHGIAEVRGKSIRERVKALIRIAAPWFRSELERTAHRYPG